MLCCYLVAFVNAIWCSKHYISSLHFFHGQAWQAEAMGGGNGVVAILYFCGVLVNKTKMLVCGTTTSCYLQQCFWYINPSTVKNLFWSFHLV